MGLASNGIRELIAQPAEWLGARGSQAEIILASRVRIARNLTDHIFPSIADAEARVNALAAIKPAAMENNYLKGAAFFAFQDLTALNRQVLVERRMASPDLTKGPAGAGALISSEQTLSLMINEEDHLRLQSLFSGLDLLEAFRIVDQIDDLLQERLDFAYSEELGFLTACPTNVGTGLRSSVLIHLPALVLTQKIDEVLKSVHQVGMSVRGLYGESTEISGNLFQISNQTSLGRTELEIIESVERAGRHLLENELQARAALMDKAKHETEDKVWRASSILENARVLTSQEFLNLSSAVRMGRAMGIIDRPGLAVINELLVLTQPAHLQVHSDREMEPRERDIVRAELVREKLKAQP